MRYSKLIIPILLSLLVIVTIGCRKKISSPKPRGYFRLALPEKKYVHWESACPFSFDIPSYSHMVRDTSPTAESCWYTLQFPSLNASVYLSFKNIHKNLNTFTEDAHTLVYKHTIKADAIEELPIVRKQEKVYGILYEIKGNAASPYQFFVTDSVNYYLRGSLYFNCQPNQDSLAPVIKFVENDIKRMLNSLVWKIQK